MPVYLDHNATTPLAPEVLEAMMPYLSSIYGNPSSVHRYGRLARNALDLARGQVAQLVGANENQVVFTSGGTESNNLAIKGSLAGLQKANFSVSEIEHPSLLEPARQQVANGWQLNMIPVNTQGKVTVDNLQQTLDEQTRLVSVMAANNETGAIQDLAALVQKSREINSDILFHSDACQMAGKLPVNFNQIGLDLMSLSSHKLYGPQGTGALIVDRRVDLQAQISGGGQEQFRRSGTENLAAIVGFGAAAELARNLEEERAAHSRQLQQSLKEMLVRLDGIQIFSAEVPVLPNTVQFAVPGIDGETLLMLLDRKGFAVSSGSACQSGKTEPSHVLLAMGVEPLLAKGAIRVSFGQQNTQQEVSQLVEALVSISQQFN